jgi:hypothetical protein
MDSPEPAASILSSFEVSPALFAKQSTPDKSGLLALCDFAISAHPDEDQDEHDDAASVALAELSSAPVEVKTRVISFKRAPSKLQLLG